MVDLACTPCLGHKWPGGRAALRRGTGMGMMGMGQHHPAAAPKPVGATGLTWAREMQESSLTAELLTLTPLTLALSLIVSQAQGAGPGRADGGDRGPPCPREGGRRRGLCPPSPTQCSMPLPGLSGAAEQGPAWRAQSSMATLDPRCRAPLWRQDAGDVPSPVSPCPRRPSRAPSLAGSPAPAQLGAMGTPQQWPSPRQAHI